MAKKAPRTAEELQRDIDHVQRLWRGGEKAKAIHYAAAHGVAVSSEMSKHIEGMHPRNRP